MAMEAAVKKLDRLWRSFVTTLCFIIFGAGGTLMSVAVMPLLLLLPGSVATRRARARSVIGICFRLLVRTLTITGCLRLQTKGLDRLARTQGALVLANHPTYIDVVVLISLMPQANCVVKGALWRNPFYWGIVRAAGYINNASPEGVIDSCVGALRQGDTLLLFPEGTRTTPGTNIRFQRGAAHVLLRSATTVTPILISCDPPTLTKHSPWWLAPERKFTFGVEVCEPLPQLVEEVAASETAVIGARRLTATLENYFSHKLRRYGYT